MELIYKDNQKRKINKKEDIGINVANFGLYLVRVDARASDEKALGGTDDEDLTLTIDHRPFPFINNLKRLKDSPAAFSGGQLKGRTKSVYYLIPFVRGNHVISLSPDISAMFESLQIWKTSDDLSLDKLDLPLKLRAEDGDRRPWITFAFVNIGLKSFSLDLILKRRFMDSDDVKIVIDGEILRNHRSLKHKLWYFISSIISGEEMRDTFVADFTPGLHYLELWADRQPTINQIVFNSFASVPEDIIRDKIVKEANKINLDPNLFIRLAKKESQFNPFAVSPANAKGIFQLTDITVKQVEHLGFTLHDPFDYAENIKAGMVYFNWLYEQYKNSTDPLRKTLAAWNYGPSHIPIEGPLDFDGLPNETKNLINFVLDN